MQLDQIEIIFSLLGISFIFTRIPQILKLVERKSSDDISLLYWYLITILTLPWVWYSIYVKESFSLSLTYILTTILNCVVIYFVYKYKIKDEYCKNCLHMRKVRAHLTCEVLSPQGDSTGIKKFIVRNKFVCAHWENK